ncbi:MAG TPA: hypothetical protein VIK07_04825 [Bacteroidales bacterium]
MNSREDYIKDPFRKYFTPEMSVKAPAEFTSKVMKKIQLEPLSVKKEGLLRNKNLVPYISVVITLILISAALVLQGDDAGSAAFSFVTSLLKNINLPLPKIDLSSLFKIKVPEFLTYILIGLLILGIFDRGLNRLFHRRKSQ